MYVWRLVRSKIYVLYGDPDKNKHFIIVTKLVTILTSSSLIKYIIFYYCVFIISNEITDTKKRFLISEGSRYDDMSIGNETIFYRFK